MTARTREDKQVRAGWLGRLLSLLPLPVWIVVFVLLGVGIVGLGGANLVAR